MPVLSPVCTLVSPGHFLLNADAWALPPIKQPEPLGMDLPGHLQVEDVLQVILLAERVENHRKSGLVIPKEDLLLELTENLKILSGVD